MRAHPAVPLIALVAFAPGAPAASTAWAGGAQSGKLLVPDGAAGDALGHSVAMSGSFAVVGMPGDDNDKGVNVGRTDVFDLATGESIATFVPLDGAPGDEYGSAVAISGDLAIGGAYLDHNENGPDAGAAYVFRFDAGGAQQVAKLLAADGKTYQSFGFAVGLSGTTAVVGALGDDENGWAAGAAYLFDATTGTEVFKLLPEDGVTGDRFGTAVAIRANDVLVGALAHGIAGAVYHFDATTGAQLEKMQPPGGSLGDTFGEAVALDGNTVLIGSSGDDDKGFQSGSAYLFDLATGQFAAKLVASDGASLDALGRSVSIRGGMALVGAAFDDAPQYDSGSAYLFDAATGVQLAKLVPSDGALQDYFGTAVATDGTIALVGAPQDDDLGIDSGSVYVFEASPAVTSYCTAGTSASGCRATLSASGVPSASESSGFVVDAQDVEGAKDGLFFFGANGAQAVPWGNGTSLQCVVPPVKRASLLAGTGTPGTCDGSLAQDLNAFWCPTCPKPQKNPGAGAQVQVQLWYRDPVNTSNQTTGLSDAIEFWVLP